MRHLKLSASLCALVLLLAATTASAFALAMWTGRVEYVTTVTYQQGVSCEYDYLGNKFWKTFVHASSCPSSIEVQ